MQKVVVTQLNDVLVSTFKQRCFSVKFRFGFGYGTLINNILNTDEKRSG